MTTAREAVLGVDIGTSSARCLVVSDDGEVLASAAVDYGMQHPHPGWAEQSPQTWWDAFASATATVGAQAAAEGVRIGAIGLSGQQAGLVATDEQDRPTGPALLWCDNRSDDDGRRLTEQAAASARSYGGPVTGAQWAAKLAWAQARGEASPGRVMGVKDYVRQQLCPSAHVTDPVEASVSGLFDVERGDWVPSRVAELGLSASALPQVWRADEIVGTLARPLAERLQLPPDIPVTVGIGDCGAAGLGVGAVRPGDEYVGFGSSGITFRVQGEFLPDEQMRTRTCAYLGDRSWFTMGVVQTLGLSWAWWRSILAQFSGRELGHDEIEAAGGASEPGAHGLVFLPYLMGDQTPHMDGKLRGSFAGLSISHTAPDMTRAVLEGMAFAMKDAVEALPGTPGEGPLVLTGKAVENALFLQTLAAAIDRPVATVRVHEGSAYGAAALALAAAHGQPVADVSRSWVEQSDLLIEPSPDLIGPVGEAYERYRAALPAADVLRAYQP